jgi:hypothetical protein
MGPMNWRIWCSVALLATSLHAQTAEHLRIVPLIRGGEVLVSFELPEAYDTDIHDLIFSGLQTTFTYDVDLRLIVPFWADRTIVSAVVSNTNRYDGLTGRHNLSRTVDGRVVETMVTRDEEVVKSWLMNQSRLLLCETSRLQPNHDYYVRVRARGRPQTDSVLARLNNAITGQVKFTFIP